MNLRFCSPGRILPYLFYFSLFYFLLWCWKPARAQSVTAYKPLQIGDTVPNVTINNILHYKTPTAKLSDFKGKLLILDFWATWCAPCVAMIPRMDSLQTQFESEVRFLPVSYQTEKEIVSFNEKYSRRVGKRIERPEVVGDQLLKQLFYHNALPHYVWISGDGVVKAITSQDQITEKHIRAFLASQKQTLSEKKDIPKIAYDRKSTPLLQFLTAAQPQMQGQIAAHSIFTPYIEGLGAEYYLKMPKTASDTWRVTCTNTAPFWLLRIAFGKGKQFLSENTLSVEVKDPASLISDLHGEEARIWARKHMIGYELELPGHLASKAWEFMQQDVTRYCKEFEVFIEKRKKICLVLTRTSDQIKFKSAGAKFSSQFDGMSLQVTGDTFEGLAMSLNSLALSGSDYPVVDQTGYTGKIDLNLEGRLSDISSLNEALATYDLKLIEKELEMDFLVIRDRPFSAQ